MIDEGTNTNNKQASSIQQAAALASPRGPLAHLSRSLSYLDI